MTNILNLIFHLQQVLLAQFTKSDTYRSDVEDFLNYAQYTVQKNEWGNGMTWWNPWGSCRYAGL